jgi:hypothetical protein
MRRSQKLIGRSMASATDGVGNLMNRKIRLDPAFLHCSIVPNHSCLASVASASVGHYPCSHAAIILAFIPDS